MFWDACKCVFPDITRSLNLSRLLSVLFLSLFHRHRSFNVNIDWLTIWTNDGYKRGKPDVAWSNVRLGYSNTKLRKLHWQISLSVKIMPTFLYAILINTLGVEKRIFFSWSVVISNIAFCIYQGAKIRMFFDLQT